MCKEIFSLFVLLVYDIFRAQTFMYKTMKYLFRGYALYNHKIQILLSNFAAYSTVCQNLLTHNPEIKEQRSI